MGPSRSHRNTETVPATWSRPLQWATGWDGRVDMATRFYMPASGSAPITPAFDAGWEQTGQAVRLPLDRKLALTTATPRVDTSAVTVPTTTTQDILAVQYISDPIPQQRFIGT